jgi:hypothetical protein
MATERLQLGAEGEGLTEPAVIERFLSRAISGEVEQRLPTIPDCDREHAPDPRQRLLDAPGVEGVDEYFRIGMPAK